MRAALPLVALATLAACQAESALQREEKVQAAAATLSGWDRLFGSPGTTIPSANQFGFRAGDYAAAPDGGYRSGSAAPIMMSSSAAKAPNSAGFAATGATAQAIDVIALHLDITDPRDADTAKGRFSTLIRDFLFQAKADGFVPVGSAIAAERPAEGRIDGAAWRLTRDALPAGGETRRLTVTFTRPDTKSATSSS
jgi:hypothetical protein